VLDVSDLKKDQFEAPVRDVRFNLVKGAALLTGIGDSTDIYGAIKALLRLY
jgi:hypothetical protein